MFGVCGVLAPREMHTRTEHNKRRTDDKEKELRRRREGRTER